MQCQEISNGNYLVYNKNYTFTETISYTIMVSYITNEANPVK